MADYTVTDWIDEQTKLGPTNLDKLEAGVKDAAEHNKYGPRSARPVAGAASKNHLWRDHSGAVWYCDGTEWMPLSRSMEPTERNILMVEGENMGAQQSFAAGPGLIERTAFRLDSLAAEATFDEIQLNFWRDSGVTDGTIYLDVLPDDGAGAPAPVAQSLGTIKAFAATLLPTARSMWTKKFKAATPITIPANTPIYLVVRRSNLTGGSVHLSEGTGGNERYEYSGAWGAAQPGSIGYSVNAHPAALRVRPSSGFDYLEVDSDGLYAGGRKVVGADGSSDFGDANLAPSAGEKAALVGKGGSASGGSTPGATNPYLLRSDRMARWQDYYSPGQTDFFSQGLWLVECTYGYSPSEEPGSRTIGAALVLCSIHTGGTNQRYINIMSSISRWSHTPLYFEAINDGTTSAVFRVRSGGGSAGNVRVSYFRWMGLP